MGGAKSGKVFMVAGGVLMLVGLGLFIGNRSGGFPTFPFAGWITMSLGLAMAVGGRNQRHEALQSSYAEESGDEVEAEIRVRIEAEKNNLLIFWGLIFLFGAAALACIVALLFSLEGLSFSPFRVRLGEETITFLLGFVGFGFPTSVIRLTAVRELRQRKAVLEDQLTARRQQLKAAGF